MNELDVIRAACEELAEPTEGAAALARDALRREIAATSDPVPTRRRPGISLVGSLGLAAALAVVAAFVLATDRTSFGARIAAAATEAVSPAGSELVHSISRTTVRITNRVGTTTSEERDDSWWTTKPPTEVTRTSYSEGGPATQLTSACGSVTYYPTENLFTVSPTTGTFNPITDPVATARNALRSGHVHYRGKLHYRGIAAAKLVVTQYGSTTTYIVRRDNGYPLETIDRRVTSYVTRTAVTTYALFEHVARTPRTLRHVELTPHPGAFVVRTGRASRTKDCAGFGKFEALTQRRTVK